MLVEGRGRWAVSKKRKMIRKFSLLFYTRGEGQGGRVTPWQKASNHKFVLNVHVSQRTIIQLVLVIAWFLMIFVIITTSDISELLYVISWAVMRVKFETILKYHECYLCQISRQIMLLFVYTTTHKRLVIFTCKYFKLNWNTTILSQSNCRNFSCSSIRS